MMTVPDFEGDKKSITQHGPTEPTDLAKRLVKAYRDAMAGLPPITLDAEQIDAALARALDDAGLRPLIEAGDRMMRVGVTFATEAAWDAAKRGETT